MCNDKETTIGWVILPNFYAQSDLPDWFYYKLVKCKSVKAYSRKKYFTKITRGLLHMYCLALKCHLIINLTIDLIAVDEVIWIYEYWNSI